MRHPFLHILVVFLILGIFAWWLMNRVSVSSSIHDIFASEGETAIQPEPTPEEQEMKFMEKAIAELPEPPQEHAPQVAALLARLQALPPIPFLLEEARKRDAATPEGQDPTPWSSAELAALAEFRRNFFSAWEDFWSGPEPDWTKFPDSTLFFRQKIMSLVSEDPYKMALYNPSARVSAGSEFSPELEFILRLARQLQGLGALRFGHWFSSWTFSDGVGLTKGITTEIISHKEAWVGESNPQTLRELRQLARPPPTVESIRRGLESDHALFLRASFYLDSLPASTPARIGLARYLNSFEEANWFLPDETANARELASYLRRDADQILGLEQKTFLSAPAWRQWLSGNPRAGLSPTLAKSLDGFEDFEEVRIKYQVTLSLLDATIAYREGGLNAATKIPDPAQPDSFLQVEQTESGTTITSSYQESSESEPFSITLPAETPSP